MIKYLLFLFSLSKSKDKKGPSFKETYKTELIIGKKIEIKVFDLRQLCEGCFDISAVIN